LIYQAKQFKKRFYRSQKDNRDLDLVKSKEIVQLQTRIRKNVNLINQV